MKKNEEKHIGMLKHTSKNRFSASVEPVYLSVAKRSNASM